MNNLYKKGNKVLYCVYSNMNYENIENNINYDIQEQEVFTSENDIENLLSDFENIELINEYYDSQDEMYASMNNYEVNYTVKHLQQIIDYYEIKLGKGRKKKDDLICEILLFEEKLENVEIVFRRKEMWYYMEELKKDKFMKKFIFGF